MATTKKVLVKFGDHCRPVQFTGDHDELVLKTKEEFALNQQEDLLLQIKDEDWGGEFIDLSASDEIPDKSVLKLVLLKKQV